LREVVGAVVRARIDKKSAFGEIQTFAKQKIDADDQAKFQEMAETELLVCMKDFCEVSNHAARILDVVSGLGIQSRYMSAPIP